MGQGICQQCLHLFFEAALLWFAEGLDSYLAIKIDQDTCGEDEENNDDGGGGDNYVHDDDED
eukprot:2925235-Karenia_brevis.AAC.1